MAIDDKYIPSPSRTTQELPQEVVVEDASEVQRGYYKKPSFFNDVSSFTSSSAFQSGVRTAALFTNVISSLKSDFRREDDEGTIFRLTQKEYIELQKKAQSISNFSKIPYDVCEDFLLILCYVDNISDMRKIAEAVQISELNDQYILRKPMVILSIPKLEKVAFAASALEGLVHMFRKYISTANNVQNKSNNESVDDILDTLGSLMGGIGGLGGASARLNNSGAEDALGNFLSELITGKRIPMTIISKNPMLQAPSYAGQAFFGEHPNPLSNVDVDQLFNKKIACFPRPSNGAGTSSFSFQNMGTFNSAMPIKNVVAKILTGNSSITAGSKKERQVNTMVSKINNITGSRSDESVEMRRADNALPIITAVSTCFTGLDKCPFSSATFQNAWMISNAVSNYLLNNDPTFIEGMKRFL